MYKIEFITYTDSRFDTVRAIRTTVFTNEQGAVANEEFDKYDNDADFALVVDDSGKIAGTGRVALTDREIEVLNSDGRTSVFNLLQVGILLTQEGAGAPLFNSRGEICAIACTNELENMSQNRLVNYAISAEDAYNAYEIMSRGERVNGDTDLPFVLE